MIPVPTRRRHDSPKTGVFRLQQDVLVGPRAADCLSELQNACAPERCGLVLLSVGVQRSSVALSQEVGDHRWDASMDLTLLAWLSPVQSAELLRVPSCLRESLGLEALAIPIASPFERFGVLVVSQSVRPVRSSPALESVASDLALQLESQHRKLTLARLKATTLGATNQPVPDRVQPDHVFARASGR
ncbi:MAG: hypothetical protein RJA70_840 [Pseudomonadota bacterium]|jgi:hypothetical protein